MTGELYDAFLSVLRSESVSRPRFRGPTLDASGLDSVELGLLLPEAWRVVLLARERAPDAAWDAANQVMRQADEHRPTFTDGAALPALKVLVSAHEHPGEPLPFYDKGWLLQRAVEIVRWTEDPLSEKCRELLSRLPLRADDVNQKTATHEVPFLRLALALIAGGAIAERVLAETRDAHADAPLLHQELDVVQKMPGRQPLKFAETVRSYQVDVTDGEIDPPGGYPLADLEGYMAFAEAAWAEGLRRLAAIHRGDVAYQPHKAFDIWETRVLGRVARVGLDRDCQWLDQGLRQMWFQASLAPDQKAKTTPSQALSFELGHAVQQRPTPHSVTVMREVANAARHAGVKKKLARFQRTAERRLAARPDLILLLPRGEPVPKPLVTTVKRSYEQLYRHNQPLRFEDWHQRFFDLKPLRSMTEKLIWQICDDNGTAATARPALKRGAFQWQRADGSVLAKALDQQITLWHPLLSDVDEREAWRDVIVSSKIKQPFAQAFRENYRPDDDDLTTSSTDLFAGYSLDVRRLLGVAQAQGWAIDHVDGLILWLGDQKFLFDVGHGLYPGALGHVKSGAVTVSRRTDLGDLQPARLGDVNPIVLSEVLRSVDLLTSVAAFAYDPVEHYAALHAACSETMVCGEHMMWRQNLPGGQSANMRCSALRRLYQDGGSNCDVGIEARHVRIRDYKIHIATARVTRHGDPVEFALPAMKAGAVWMPYDDEIMARIIRSIDFLAHNEPK